MKKPLIIGVISDTHGLLRPQAYDALRGSELIIHAGDVGKPDILTTLESIAPVVAIRGNVDRTDTAHLPDTETLTIGDLKLYVLHDLKQLSIDPAQCGYRVVISGHSHKPDVTEKEAVLYLNPGAAGPRRFKLPVTVARLSVRHGTASAEIIELDV